MMTGKAIPADARRADSPIKRPEVGNGIRVLGWFLRRD